MDQRSICQCVDVVHCENFDEHIGEYPFLSYWMLARSLVTSTSGQENMGRVELSREAVSNISTSRAMGPKLLIGAVFDLGRVGYSSNKITFRFFKFLPTIDSGWVATVQNQSLQERLDSMRLFFWRIKHAHDVVTFNIWDMIEQDWDGAIRDSWNDIFTFFVIGCSNGTTNVTGTEHLYMIATSNPILPLLRFVSLSPVSSIIYDDGGLILFVFRVVPQRGECWENWSTRRLFISQAGDVCVGDVQTLF